MQTKVLTVLALALTLATPAYAIFGAGIVRGNDYRVVVDSVKWGLRGSPFPVWEVTSGWEADPTMVDTFRFQVPEDRPLWGEFHYSVTGQDTFLAVNPLEADRWLDLPLPGGVDVAPQLMYRDSLTSGIGSNGTPGYPSMVMASPNPFRASAHLSLRSTPSASRVDVFDMAGQHVRTLELRPTAQGLLAGTWDGSNRNGRRVSAGVYFVRVAPDACTRLVLLD